MNKSALAKNNRRKKVPQETTLAKSGQGFSLVCAVLKSFLKMLEHFFPLKHIGVI